MGRHAVICPWPRACRAHIHMYLGYIGTILPGPDPSFVRRLAFGAGSKKNNGMVVRHACTAEFAFGTWHSVSTRNGVTIDQPSCAPYYRWTMKNNRQIQYWFQQLKIMSAKATRHMKIITKRHIEYWFLHWMLYMVLENVYLRIPPRIYLRFPARSQIYLRFQGLAPYVFTNNDGT